jgi:hypothetical protein
VSLDLAGEPASAGECLPCLMWELRYRVAARASYYLTIRIREPALRERVLEDIVGSWWRICMNNERRTGFGTFLAAYIADVERNVAQPGRDVDLACRNAWNDHALAIG